MAWTLIALGASLRLVSYLRNQTFSTDEAALTLNITHRSYSGLLDPLDFNQGAPVGFLFIQKALFQLFGASDYVFRALPLAASLVALLLIWPVAAQFIGRRAGLLALTLFGILEPLLFYAATAKQYSLDAAVALGLYAVVSSAERELGRRRTLAFAVVAVAAVWLSHAAVFVVAGIVSVLSVEALVKRRTQRVVPVLALAGASVASFAAVYAVALRALGDLQGSFARGRGFVAGETEGGLPRALASAARYLLGLPENPGGVGAAETIAVVGVVLALIGFAALARTRWPAALLLVAPLGFVLVASAIGQYPLVPRALLFLTPALVMLATKGVELLAAPGRPRVLRGGAAAAGATVLIAAGVTSARALLSDHGDDVKETLRHLAARQRAEDSLYVFHTLQYTFRYYLECECFGDGAVVSRGLALWPLNPAAGGTGQNDPALRSVPPDLVIGTHPGISADEHVAELAVLRGRPRVWILLGESRSVNLEAVLAAADRLGRRRTTYRPRTHPTGAYLYDLSRRR